MKQLVVVCVALLVLSSPLVGNSASETFALADRIGERSARTFFLFSTAGGQYTIRHDGMGEVAYPERVRRVFNLRLGGKGRIGRIYFLEHEGDLLLLYEVNDATSEWAYLLRMQQRTRKPRWLTPLPAGEIQTPTISGDFVIVGNTQIRKADGHVQPPN